MAPEVRKLVGVTCGTVVVGALFGLLIGGLMDNPLVWAGIMAAGALPVGVAFGYGFLPEH